MPKEYIVTQHERRRQEELGGPTAAVRVGWQRDGWVQIASLQCDGGPDAIGDAEKGQFIDLDRHAINALILVLRRARDQAYGRDE
jgi:hypothetical protein